MHSSQTLPQRCISFFKHTHSLVLFFVSPFLSSKSKIESDPSRISYREAPGAGETRVRRTPGQDKRATELRIYIARATFRREMDRSASPSPSAARAAGGPDIRGPTPKTQKKSRLDRSRPSGRENPQQPHDRAARRAL